MGKETVQLRSDAQIVVLFVAASHLPSVRSRVNEEFKKIVEKIRESEYRDVFHFERIQAIRFADIRTALLRHCPHILHISSRGEEDGSLTFESEEEGRHVVFKSQLLKLLRALPDNLRLVFFNSAHSKALASDVPPLIDLSIGMNTTVPDPAAIEFAVTFYEALAYGRTVENAVEIAHTGLEDEHELLLFPTRLQDHDGKRQLRFANPLSLP